MVASRVAAAIPPQPSWVQQSKKAVTPLHMSAWRRLVYGTNAGVVVRSLPDQVLLGKSPVEVYGGSKRPITCATASLDGRVVAGGDNDGYCHIWLNEGGKVNYSCYKQDHMRYVHLTDICLTADGQRLAVVGLDQHSQVHGAVLLVDTGAKIGAIKGHVGGISSVCFSPNKPYQITTAGVDGKVCVHTGPPYKCTQTVEASPILTCVRYSPSGNYLVVSGAQGYLAVFDRQLKLITDADLGMISPISLAWSRNRDDTFAVACNDNSIHVLQIDFKLESVTVAHNIPTHEHIPRGILWSENHWVLALTDSGAILAWKLLDGADRSCKTALLEQSLKEELKEEAHRRASLSIPPARGSVSDTPTKSSSATPSAIATEAATPTPSSPPAAALGGRRRRLSVCNMGVDGALPLTPPHVSSSPQWQYDWAKLQTAQPHLRLYGPKGGPSVVHFDMKSSQLLIGTNMGYLMFLDTGMVIPHTFDVARMESDRQIRSCITNGLVGAAAAADGCVKVYKYSHVNIKSNEDQFGVQQCYEILRGTNAEATTTTYKPKTRTEVKEIGEFRLSGLTPLALMFLKGTTGGGVTGGGVTGGGVTGGGVTGGGDTGGGVTGGGVTGGGDRTNYIGLFTEAGTLNVYRIQNNDVSEIWNVKMRIKPLCVSATQDGSLICVAVMATAADYPDAMKGDQELSDDQVVIEIYEVVNAASIQGFKFIKMIPTKEKKVTAISINRDGTLVAYSSGTYIRVRETDPTDPNKMVVDNQWGEHRTRVCDLAWSPNGNRLISTSTHELFVWNIHSLHTNIKLKDNHSGYNLFAR
ncbi:putative WD-repeat protein [Gregarina niphandrodes]|uniref:WD-repeat protein n=1 Tax=Gregarina niphandrodes TaxID=110365 RepID=A0A023B4E6_GRENI|nr:putative WD-repeat protein [Gregarina niphandrodes]EZG56720.1 putative WD-repeat protein [Gregarina niphandrodes]|eukprot:XP_011131188.1 putative WD-repeat protein [Gregarina niphandrodes]